MVEKAGPPQHELAKTGRQHKASAIPSHQSPIATQSRSSRLRHRDHPALSGRDQQPPTPSQPSQQLIASLADHHASMTCRPRPRATNEYLTRRPNTPPPPADSAEAAFPEIPIPHPNNAGTGRGPKSCLKPPTEPASRQSHAHAPPAGPAGAADRHHRLKFAP